MQLHFLLLVILKKYCFIFVSKSAETKNKLQSIEKVLKKEVKYRDTGMESLRSAFQII